MEQHLRPSAWRWHDALGEVTPLGGGSQWSFRPVPWDVLWGWCVFRLPVGPWPRLCWGDSYQESWRWVEEDQRMLGLHSCHRSAGNFTFLLAEWWKKGFWMLLVQVQMMRDSCVKVLIIVILCCALWFFPVVFISWLLFAVRKNPAVKVPTTNWRLPSCCGCRPTEKDQEPWT